jgi:cytochrome c peroxidase
VSGAGLAPRADDAVRDEVRLARPSAIDARARPPHRARNAIDDFQANRAPGKGYRTAPLRGLWTHVKGGFYHDGRFATLFDVVNHYNLQFSLQLSDQEKRDLVEDLKSL